MKVAVIMGFIGLTGMVFSNEAKRSAVEVLEYNYVGIPGVLQPEYYITMSNVFFSVGILAFVVTASVMVLEYFKSIR